MRKGLYTCEAFEFGKTAHFLPPSQIYRTALGVYDWHSAVTRFSHSELVAHRLYDGIEIGGMESRAVFRMAGCEAIRSWW